VENVKLSRKGSNDIAISLVSAHTEFPFFRIMWYAPGTDHRADDRIGGGSNSRPDKQH